MQVLEESPKITKEDEKIRMRRMSSEGFGKEAPSYDKFRKGGGGAVY